MLLSDDNTVLPTGITDENSQIIAYKGFYVGRYESGMDVDMGSVAQKTPNAPNRNVTTKAPIIVEGSNPWNYISWTNSKINATKICPETNNYVQSGLLTGTQWDTTMKFIQDVGGKNETENNVDTNSKGWGNYKDSVKILDRYAWISTDRGANWLAENETTKDSSQLLRAGSSTETKVLNMSDLASNLFAM